MSMTHQDFGISRDDIIEVLKEEAHISRRGWAGEIRALVSEDDLAGWMGKLDHQAISRAAQPFAEMEEKTDAARSSIADQFEKMGVWENLDARLSRKQMEQRTAPAAPSPAIPRP